MTWRTSLFLVLLQLAIGVHLLYEGLWKIQNPAWTSEGYLRGSNSPVALPMRWLAGDPDVTRQDNHFVVVDNTGDLVARFTVSPFDPTEAREKRKWHQHMPPPLEQEWQAYFDRFVQHYKLDDLQKVEAERILSTAKTNTVKWLTEGDKKKAPPWFAGPAADVPRKTPDRVLEYLHQLDQIRDLEKGEVATFGPKLTAKLNKARDEAKTLKKELLEDLEDQTAQMKKALRDVLTYEQKRMAALPEESPSRATWSYLSWVDATVRYGLAIVGAGLLLGLFTRTAAIGGALFLLMFYLAAPPWPGLAENPQVKGHYLFINENIIEMLALLVIATSRPGSRYGLDAWLPFHWFRRRQTQPAGMERERKPQAREVLPDDGARVPSGQGVRATVSHS